MNCGLQRIAVGLGVALAASDDVWAQEIDRVAELKKLSLEQLLDQEITTASRKPQSLWEVPAAIEVLTSEDIHRSGNTSIADTLRLATGLHVARVNVGRWAISSRGFNSTSANKMQVFMDGRSLYTPLFSGVFWDVQDYLLDDIERIEIVRGPNATLWGANAFNGVINIITKSARDTQGVYVNAGVGTEEAGFGAVRYGGQLGENTFYRAYAKFYNRDSLQYANGSSAHNGSIMGQTGFRLDSDLTDQNSATFQGDFYDGRIGRNGFRDSVVDGANFLGRFTRKVGEESELQLQAFYDHTHRRIYGQFEEELHTFDLDALYRREINERNELMGGLNYRVYDDHIFNPIPAIFGFFPPDKTFQQINGFLQYEYKLVPDQLAATVGAKIEHNDFSGFEYQPSLRVAWTPSPANTIWAGISRAVRTPTRFEEHLRITVPAITLMPQRSFESEKVIAYELGWRSRPHERVAFDIAGFFNDYTNLRSQEPAGPPGQIQFGNLFQGEGYGLESGVDFQALDWWRVRLSYTYFEKQIYPGPASFDSTRGVAEGNDPHHFGSLRSSWDLPQNLFFDAILRYVSELPSPPVQGYVELDLRLGWRPNKNLEVAISGLNLLHDSHAEFGPPSPFREEVERRGYIEVTWRF